MADLITANRHKILGLVAVDSSLVAACECLPVSQELWHGFYAQLQDLTILKKQADVILIVVALGYSPLACWVWTRVILPVGWVWLLVYTVIVLYVFLTVFMGGLYLRVQDNYAFLVKERLFAMTKCHWNDTDHICSMLEFDIVFACLLGSGYVNNLLCISRREDENSTEGKPLEPPSEIRAMPEGEDLEFYGTPHARRTVVLWDMFRLSEAERDEIVRPWFIEAKLKEKDKDAESLARVGLTTRQKR